jgi:hypothetical protein
LLFFGSTVYALSAPAFLQWVRECDATTITTTIDLNDTYVAPCFREVGSNCFYPSKIKDETCGNKFAASTNCPVAWPTMANALGSISPPCKYGGVSTADLAGLEWTEFVVALKD